MTAAFSNYLEASLSKESVRALVELATRVEFVADEPFVIQGRPTDALFFLPDTIARYYVETETGEFSNKHFTPGPCFVGSTTALIKQIPSRINIASVETCSGSRILWAPFRALCQSNPEVLMFYTKGLEHLFIQKEERETSFLTDSARDRYANFLTQFPDLENRLPQYHIASYLGITPVSLSRIRRELKPA